VLGAILLLLVLATVLGVQLMRAPRREVEVSLNHYQLGERQIFFVTVATRLKEGEPHGEKAFLRYIPEILNDEVLAFWEKHSTNSDQPLDILIWFATSPRGDVPVEISPPLGPTPVRIPGKTVSAFATAPPEKRLEIVKRPGAVIVGGRGRPPDHLFLR